MRGSPSNPTDVHRANGFEGRTRHSTECDGQGPELRREGARYAGRSERLKLLACTWRDQSRLGASLPKTAGPQRLGGALRANK